MLEIAERYLIEPPAGMYTRLLGARDEVFTLIAGRQQPRHTIGLYKIAGQVCALLAHATFDLGYPHAAHAHARTALHCVEVSGQPWLAIAATVPTDPTPHEPGVLAFTPGKAAYYASEAHFALGGTEHLDAALHAQLADRPMTMQVAVCGPRHCTEQDPAHAYEVGRLGGTLSEIALAKRRGTIPVITLGGWSIHDHHGNPLPDPPTPASSPRHAVELAIHRQGISTTKES